MPIYEYFCDRCKVGFEKLCRISEADEVECPDCGGKAEKKFSTFFAHGGSRSDSCGASISCGSCSGGNCSSCGCH